jgi:hypothetical protein
VRGVIDIYQVGYQHDRGDDTDNNIFFVCKPPEKFKKSFLKMEGYNSFRISPVHIYRAIYICRTLKYLLRTVKTGIMEIIFKITDSLSNLFKSMAMVYERYASIRADPIRDRDTYLMLYLHRKSPSRTNTDIAEEINKIKDVSNTLCSQLRYFQDCSYKIVYA